MASKALPSIEVLRQLLRYDPETGKLLWLARDERRVEAVFNGLRRVVVANANFNKTLAGHEAFTATGAGGYRVGAVNGKVLLAHRVIWAIMTGEWPKGQIDHADRDKQNNRWENLREATASQNQHNKRKRPNSSSDFIGVAFRSDTTKWDAQIKVNGRREHLGCFVNEVDAAKAYDQKAKSVFGEFARQNFSNGNA